MDTGFTSWKPYLCPVCGGPFNLEGFYDLRVLPADQAAWIKNVQVFGRAVHLRNLLAVNESSDPRVFISGKTQWDPIHRSPRIPNRGSDPAIYEEIGIYAGSQPLFPLHSACLHMLKKFTQQKRNTPLSQPLLLTTIAEFLSAFTAQQQYIFWFHHVSWWSGQLVELPQRYYEFADLPHRFWEFGGIEFPHFYFGARRFWADAWHCEPGAEYFYANPLYDSQATKQFISTCLTYPQPGCQFQPSASSVQLTKPLLPKPSPILHCPTEILLHVFSYVPLRSVLNLYAASQTLASCLPPFSMFLWRSRTLDLNRNWLWELGDFETYTSEANWKALLQRLSATRREILAETESYRQYCRSANNGGGIEDYYRQTEDVDEKWELFPSIPLGLRNRLRIWMCLEYVNSKSSRRTPEDQQHEGTISLTS